MFCVEPSFKQYFQFHNTQSLWKDGTKLIRELMQFTGGRIQENLQWFNNCLAEKC